MDIVLVFDGEEQKRRMEAGVSSTELAEVRFRDVQGWAIVGTHAPPSQDAGQPGPRATFVAPNLPELVGRAAEMALTAVLQGVPQGVVQALHRAAQQQQAQREGIAIASHLNLNDRIKPG